MGCRGQRLCGSIVLAAREGATNSSPTPWYLHEDTREALTKKFARQHLALGKTFHCTPTHNEGDRREDLVGRSMWMGVQSSIASSWSAKSSNILPMSSRMETVAFLLETELRWEKCIRLQHSLYIHTKFIQIFSTVIRL